MKFSCAFRLEFAQKLISFHIVSANYSKRQVRTMETVYIGLDLPKIPSRKSYPFRIFCGQMSIHTGMVLSCVTTAVYCLATLVTLILVLNNVFGTELGKDPKSPCRWYLMLSLAIKSLWVLLILLATNLVLGVLQVSFPKYLSGWKDLNAPHLALCLSFFFIFATVGPILKLSDFHDKLAWWIFALSVSISLNSALNCYIWWAFATCQEWLSIQTIGTSALLTEEQLQHLTITTTC